MIRYNLSDLLTLATSLLMPFTEFVQVERASLSIEIPVTQQEEVNTEIEVKESIPAINLEVPNVAPIAIKFGQVEDMADARVIDSNDLPSLTVRQLRSLCKDLEVKIPKHMNKKDIIQVIKATQVFPLLLPQ